MNEPVSSRRILAVLVGTLALLGCGKGAAPLPGASLTWNKDIANIVAANCTNCHSANGIAPFPLVTSADLRAEKASVKSALQTGLMPPWPPDPSCNSYKGDRSLSAADKQAIIDWLDAGAAEGNPSDLKPPPPPRGGLSRVDSKLSMKIDYQPQLIPDEYRCFVLDWSETKTRYVTGFAALPGNAAMVHHAIAYLAQPEEAAMFQAMDTGNGYQCFGGPGGNSFAMIGAWAPGSLGNDFPVNTGIKVRPGSKVVLQVHYNTGHYPDLASIPKDRTAVALKLDDSVGLEAFVFPFANPGWFDGLMPIPAGLSDVSHAFAADPSPYLGDATGGVIPANTPYMLYAALPHMHLRGKHIHLEVQRQGGAKQCIIDVPHWDFHWQGSYEMTQPVQVLPGDKVSLECHWDNSASNQPVGPDGHALTPTDLNWGEGTGDEMCLALVYITK